MRSLTVTFTLSLPSAKADTTGMQPAKGETPQFPQMFPCLFTLFEDGGNVHTHTEPV